MPEPSILLRCAAALASFAGFAWIALTVGGHWRQAGGSAALPPTRRRRLRQRGAAALALALVLCLAADSPGMAALLWAMLLSLGATGVALVLAWRPDWLRRLTR